jgi:hypothetical protein
MAGQNDGRRGNVRVSSLKSAASSRAVSCMGVTRRSKAFTRARSSVDDDCVPGRRPRDAVHTFFDDPDLVPADKLRSQACSPVAENVDLTPPPMKPFFAGLPCEASLQRSLCRYEKRLSLATGSLAAQFRL